MKQPLHPNDFADQLEDPERHFPGNFETEGKAVAALLCLCQDAAIEIRWLWSELHRKTQAVFDLYEEIDQLKAEKK
jgi:hypothetical protein